MSFVCLIPARKNSRRLKNKNMRILKGKPLIYYTIKSSTNSKFIKQTYVFSDSEKIINYSKKFNISKCCERPKNVSRSKTPMSETVEYFVRKMKLKQNKKLKYLILLQPTSPQRKSRDIDMACKLILKNPKADSLVSSFQIKGLDVSRLMFLNNSYLHLNKNLKFKKKTLLFHRNGPSILITKIKNITKTNLYEKGKILNFVMKRENSIDIDDLSDFKKAQKDLNYSIKNN